MLIKAEFIFQKVGEFSLCPIPYEVGNSYGHPPIDVIDEMVFWRSNFVVDVFVVDATEHNFFFLTFIN